MDTFVELEKFVPGYVMNNITLMRYEKPTPIQKHAVSFIISM